MSLLGHEAQQQHLLNLTHKNRLPGGLLLTGPQGVGKSTLAQAFATYLLAGEKGEALSLTDTHPVARRMASGGHGDFLKVQKGLNAEGKPMRDIPVAEVRKVIDFMHKTPLEGGWRVVIIDSIDEMNRNAANALLKVLEEPPAHAILLLVCHSPGKVLPTIRSRCQELTFNALSDAQMKSFLKPQGLEDFEIQEVVDLSEGRPGYALQLIESQGLSVYKDLLSSMEKSGKFGVSAYFKLMDIYGNPMRKGATVDVFETLGALTLTCLARLVEWAVNPQLPVISGEKEAFQAALSKHPIDHWVEMWHKTTTEINQSARFSLNRKQVLAGLFQHFA